MHIYTHILNIYTCVCVFISGIYFLCRIKDKKEYNFFCFLSIVVNI